MNFELRTSNFVGIDVGGTTTRVGLVAADGKLIASDRFQTPRSSESLVDHLAARLTSLRTAGETNAGIGLALPGIVDAAKGSLVRSVNLPFMQGFPIVDELTRRTSLPVFLTTDADAATWGEYAVCNPCPARFVHLRLGTGIACGIVLNGALTRTDPERRTHRPELVVDRRSRAAMCACGLRGCLELFASGPVIQSFARRMRLQPDLTALQSDFNQGRPESQTLISGVAGWLLRGIRNILNHMTPDRDAGTSARTTVVCLGGGVLNVLPALYEHASLRWRNQPGADRLRAELHRARLGDDAGVIGAALLAAKT